MEESPKTSVSPWSYRPGKLLLLDQRRLPAEEVFLECETALQTAEAIRSLAVRGAPLIGVAAAFGIAAEAHRVASRSPQDLDFALQVACDRLAEARPTAVNLAAAVTRMRGVIAGANGMSTDDKVELLAKEAADIAEEDRKACLDMAWNGAAWLRKRIGKAARGELTLLTHCNAGALATAGVGTALGVVRALAVLGEVMVLADETRPFWQGARLTAWELLRDGIPVSILPDVAAASLIASGRVHAVVVGADRIAANGDVANKVGTYGLALACRANAVPFVVVAPSTTVDLACPDGASIPIELRDSEEVLTVTPAGAPPVRVAPPGVKALYPAFDVTPAALVDAVITEKGAAAPPDPAGIARIG